MTDLLEQFSTALADRVAAVARCVVAIGTGRSHVSGILWRPDVVVTSAQELPDRSDFNLRRAGTQFTAKLAGRDPGTNVAVLRLAQPMVAEPPVVAAAAPRVGSLALMVGADDTGAPTGRLAMVHATGPEWHSQAGGKIDALLRLDVRLGTDEGGPALDAAGSLLGMSTAGPRRRALVIPAVTIERVLDPLLAEGRIARGWLGVGLQPVAVPDSLRAAAGRDSGMMVVSLVDSGPAAAAGVLPGDIMLDLDGTPVRRPRALAAAMGPDRIGQSVSLRLLRAGTLQTLSVVIAARPAA